MLVCLVRNLANIPDNRGAQRWRKKYNIFTLTIDDTILEAEGNVEWFEQLYVLKEYICESS